MESNQRLDRLRQQAGDLAENMGTQWADYVAAVINQWTDGEEQGLLDRGAELFEMLCRDHVQTFRNDAQEDGWTAPEQDIAILDETAHAAFHKRIGEAVLPSAGTSGRANTRSVAHPRRGVPTYPPRRRQRPAQAVRHPRTEQRTRCAPRN